MTQEASRPAALVTGASRGIGRGIARRLGKAGYDLTISAREGTRLQQAAEELSDITGGSVHPVAADMTAEKDVSRLVRAHDERHGRLDVLVLGAGVGFSAPLAQTSKRRYDLQFDVNVRAAFVLVQEALPLLRKTAAGRPEHGAKVIALASITGLFAEPDLAVYGATKAALISLCQSVNAEASDDGVSATAICPGYVDTDMTAWVRDRIEPRRMIRVDDIVEMALAVTKLSPCAVVPDITVTRPGRQLGRA
ncbi:SDR family NAD(P)-dependent oxidoreductase [Streptomyces sp. NPDC057376]|uniref:SDR family NAD(P)-dependent oxidoreductase n=1 Tax=Streptomyces sp. NPDC057376 TaxID=3346110 RepID=UPI00093B5EBE|nr:short-chain dehydrogenase [Streptomyces sp. CB02414]